MFGDDMVLLLISYNFLYVLNKNTPLSEDYSVLKDLS